MSLIDPTAIGIAFFDRNGNRTEGGWPSMTTVEEAEEHIHDALERGIYDGVVKAEIYRGRSYREGEILKVVTRPTR